MDGLRLLSDAMRYKKNIPLRIFVSQGACHVTENPSLTTYYYCGRIEKYLASFGEKKTALKIVREKVVSIEPQTRTNKQTITVPKI